MLRLRDLTVRRGEARIVEGLGWEHGPGRVAWVVGPNGAGKSSLLRVLIGLDAPAAGHVELSAGRPLYFHAETGLVPHATVGDWARFIDRLLGPSAAPRTALWPAAVPSRRALGQLSTGERKRLLLDALLRARADALFLDEPLEHLSPEGKDVLIDGLVERARTMLIVVATNQRVAQAARDGGLHLEGGAATALPPQAELQS